MGGLLVYIPTYNRPELLRAQLEALRPQIQGNERVRLVVADNASTSQESLAVFSEFSGQRWLTFFRRATNIQANANILQGFLELRSGEYLWLLADDTLASPNAVALILEAIDAESPDLIGLSTDQQALLPKVLRWNSETFELITTKFSWGLISSAIYSGDFFLEFVSQAFFFHNSSFPHLGVMFSAFRERGVLNVAWIPTSGIHGENFVDGPSDYSLAVVGFPQLMYLLDERDRKNVVNRWLRTNSAGFAYYSHYQPLAAAASSVLLRGTGLRARVELRFGLLEAWVRSTSLGLKAQEWILRTPWVLERLKATKRLMYKVRT